MVDWQMSEYIGFCLLAAALSGGLVCLVFDSKIAHCTVYAVAVAIAFWFVSIKALHREVETVAVKPPKVEEVDADLMAARVTAKRLARLQNDLYGIAGRQNVDRREVRHGD